MDGFQNSKWITTTQLNHLDPGAEKIRRFRQGKMMDEYAKVCEDYSSEDEEYPFDVGAILQSKKDLKAELEKIEEKKLNRQIEIQGEYGLPPVQGYDCTPKGDSVDDVLPSLKASQLTNKKRTMMRNDPEKDAKEEEERQAMRHLLCCQEQAENREPVWVPQEYHVDADAKLKPSYLRCLATQDTPRVKETFRRIDEAARAKIPPKFEMTDHEIGLYKSSYSMDYVDPHVPLVKKTLALKEKLDKHFADYKKRADCLDKAKQPKLVFRETPGKELEWWKKETEPCIKKMVKKFIYTSTYQDMNTDGAALPIVKRAIPETSLELPGDPIRRARSCKLKEIMKGVNVTHRQPYLRMAQRSDTMYNDPNLERDYYFKTQKLDRELYAKEMSAEPGIKNTSKHEHIHKLSEGGTIIGKEPVKWREHLEQSAASIVAASSPPKEEGADSSSLNKDPGSIPHVTDTGTNHYTVSCRSMPEENEVIKLIKEEKLRIPYDKMIPGYGGYQVSAHAPPVCKIKKHFNHWDPFEPLSMYQADYKRHPVDNYEERVQPIRADRLELSGASSNPLTTFSRAPPPNAKRLSCYLEPDTMNPGKFLFNYP